MKKTVDVCLSPDLLHLYNLEDKIVVVVDILRATSCMTTAIAHGVKSIIPVASLEECDKLRAKGCLAAAERDGKIATGFDLGNSPFSYMDESINGKELAVTTTNGTLAIKKSEKAVQVLIGSFLNLSILSEYLIQQPHDILVVCAGWKGKVNLEDTLFAGALVDRLDGNCGLACDAPLAAVTLYKAAKDNLIGFLANSSHVKRLKKLDIEKDIAFCLQEDLYPVIPILKRGKLVKLKFTPVKVYTPTI
jgi:2-phosphosulfolactate phosphatase